MAENELSQSDQQPQPTSAWELDSRARCMQGGRRRQLKRVSVRRRGQDQSSRVLPSSLVFVKSALCTV